MAITSRGYTGTIDYADWAVVTSQMGGTYSVFGSDPFPLSAGAGDREVVIGAGTAAGAGILDTSDADVSLSGASVTSGSRWDMVVLRRVWGVTNATSLVLITGGSSKMLPSRNTTPGTSDDQPLYLVRFAAGQTALQEVVDLRVWRGDAGLYANDIIVRDYMNRIGTAVRVGATVWHRIQVLGSPAWYPLADKELRGPDGVHWMIESVSGKAYLQDTVAGTFPWVINRDGTLAAGRVPWARIPDKPSSFPNTDVSEATASGHLPGAGGKLARFTAGGQVLVNEPNSPFAATPKSYVDWRAPLSTSLGQITLAAGAETTVPVTLTEAATNFHPSISGSTPDFDFGWSRSGNVVTVRIINKANASRTGTVTVQLFRPNL